MFYGQLKKTLSYELSWEMPARLLPSAYDGRWFSRFTALAPIPSQRVFYITTRSFVPKDMQFKLRRDIHSARVALFIVKYPNPPFFVCFGISCATLMNNIWEENSLMTFYKTSILMHWCHIRLTMIFCHVWYNILQAW